MRKTGLSPSWFAVGGLLLLYLVVLIGFGYGVERTNFLLLLTTFAVLFFIFFNVFPLIDSQKKWYGILIFAVATRFALIGMIPNMSDDFYRFIWDGVLLANGVNPFEHLPSFYMEQTGGNPGSMVKGLTPGLFEGMNSPDYYTIYPPLCQAVFWLGAELFGGNILGNVIVMRFFMITGEVVTLWYLLKLLRLYNRDECWALLFALNPLVILELTGNLHFEAVMIAFLVAGFYYLLIKRYYVGFFLIALSINTKLIPLIFLPYLAFSLGWRKTFQMGIIVGLTTLALYMPFYDLEFIQNFFSSIELYFQKFEFNASIYYIIRWIGYQVKGYNIIETAGKHLAVYSTLLILIISWFLRNRNLRTFPAVILYALSAYYFLSPVVHPWYVTTLVAFAPLTGHLFPFVWSVMLPLTYHVYRIPDYNEIMWIVAVEYMVVYVVFMNDIFTPDFYRKLKIRFEEYCCKSTDDNSFYRHDTAVEKV